MPKTPRTTKQSRKHLEIVDVTKDFVEIKARLFRFGNSFAFRVPKPLLDSRLLEEDRIYHVRVLKK